jgi:co-chaperonin GroES (HSP10)
MSAETKSKKADRETNTADTEERRGFKSGKAMYHINPLGMRVLVRIPKDQNVTEGGLYLPEGSKESMLESLVAEVVEVASAVDDKTEEETNVSGIPLGAKVLIAKRTGVKVPWDDQLRIVETKDVLAVVESFDLS